MKVHKSSLFIPLCFLLTLHIAIAASMSFINVKDAAKANMDIVQAKLQQCVNSGQLNSFDRLSNIFAGKNDVTAPQTETADNDIEMRNTPEGKDSSKIPVKKSSTAKLAVSKMERQYGDKTSRKLAEKRQKERGRGRSGRGASLDGRKQRSSSKKRSGKKLAVIS